MERPELVQSMVVVAPAYTLGPEGRAVQREPAKRIRAGDPVGGWTQLVAHSFPPSL